MWLIAEGKERLRYNVRVNGIFRRPRVWYLVTPSFSPQDYSEKVATVLPRAGLLLGSPGRQRFYFFFGFGVKWKAWVYPCQLWCADRQAQGCEMRQQSLKIRECLLTLATLRELGVTLFSWSNNALRLADISIWYSDTVHPPVSTFFFPCALFSDHQGTFKTSEKLFPLWSYHEWGPDLRTSQKTALQTGSNRPAVRHCSIDCVRPVIPLLPYLVSCVDNDRIFREFSREPCAQIQEYDALFSFTWYFPPLLSSLCWHRFFVWVGGQWAFCILKVGAGL